MKVELNTLYSVAHVRRDFFPSRCAKWIKYTFCGGQYGPVTRDSAGWMISAQALAEYQRRHAVGAVVVELRPHQLENLRRTSRVG